MGDKYLGFYRGNFHPIMSTSYEIPFRLFHLRGHDIECLFLGVWKLLGIWLIESCDLVNSLMDGGSVTYLWRFGWDFVIWYQVTYESSAVGYP